MNMKSWMSSALSRIPSTCWCFRGWAASSNPHLILTIARCSRRAFRRLSLLACVQPWVSIPVARLNCLRMSVNTLRVLRKKNLQTAEGNSAASCISCQEIRCHDVIPSLGETEPKQAVTAEVKHQWPGRARSRMGWSKIRLLVISL